MRRLFQIILVLSSLLLLTISTPISAATPTGTVWNGHQVMVDGNNRLVSWIDSAYPYDQVMDWGWNYIQNTVPNTSAGIKHYLSYCCYFEPAGGNSNWYHNPAGLYASFVDSLIMAYPYTGDSSLITTVKGMLDYQLANGTTPAAWLWGNMPYASAVNGQTVYQGDGTSVRDGVNGIQPDKAAELGYAYLRFWQLTGNTTYRTAAINIANTLVARVRTGNATQSPWPFRVHAQTGAVLEQYTSNMVAAVNLFDELIRLNLGNVASYQTVRNQAWNWVLTYPMSNNKWNAYFEDIERDPTLANYNQVTPMETARYILSRENPATVDSQWQTHIPALLTWVKNTFGKGPFYSAQAIDEQTVCCSAYGLGSHTARWASINALWYERTADINYRNAATLAFNYATYFSDAQGRVKATFDGGSNWYTDGYGDYIKHFMSGIGSIPEWAPANENHILRSSSVVTSVTYAVNRVSYTTFDTASRDRLRLNFTPTQVTANGVVLPKRTDLNAAGWIFNPANGLLSLRHDTGTSIVVSGGSAPPTATRTPTVNPTNTPVGLQSLWTTSAVPSVPDFAGIAPIELGVKFRSSVNATVTGLRFYKGAGNIGTHTAHLWTSNGTLLATGTFVNETASGWQAVSFPAPIPITANVTYIASYYSPTGRFSYTPNFFNSPRASGVLTAPDTVSSGGNGVFTRGPNGSFPVSSSAANNFWVDVLVQPNSSPTVVPTATRTPTVMPTNTPVGLHSLWTTAAVPAIPDFAGIAPIELGVKFRSSVNATVTGLRFYKGAGNIGTHTAHLWTSNGTLLATGTFVNETASGWQAVSFPAPIPITANVTYIASYYSPTGRFSYTPNFFNSPRASGVLTAPDTVSSGGNGVFTRGPNGSFPVSSSAANNFWVDVLVQPGGGGAAAFEPTLIPPSTATPQPAATLTATPAPQSSTFTRQIVVGSDDVNQVGAVFEASSPVAWIGNGAAGAGSYTGLRFTNVQVPRGATITAAHLEFYSTTSSQWVSINLQIAADAADNSAPFSAGAMPSQRSLTTARVVHSSNQNWAANTWYPFTDMQAVVREIITRPNWQAGNSLSIILVGTGDAWARKFISAYESGAAYAPRLVISYRAS